MVVETSVKISGLKELGGAFKQIDRGLPRELRGDFLGLAKSIAARAASTVPGRAGGAIVARATPKSAGIAFPGGETREGKFPYYPWLDFGGTTGKGHKIGAGGSGSIRRTSPKGGRYVYPTIGQSREEIKDAVELTVEKVAKHAGFEVKG